MIKVLRLSMPNVPDLLARLQAALADRYRLQSELGQGGMAAVYLAEDLKHHRQVAIKVLRPELAAMLGAERFLQEIETTAGLRHPHILPLYDSGEIRLPDPDPASAARAYPPMLFYVMPWIEGGSLRERLNAERQLPLDEALRITREVADALGYAHRRGVLHRDIKPENILLESGHAVVADFGIARAIDAAGGERLTETGLTVGTPAYMSPEQAAGDRSLDSRSDLYALGCVLYEMLAGQPPFTGPSPQSLVRQHLSATPPSITQLRPAVTGGLAGTLERALAKAPADRFNTVEEFAAALAGIETTAGRPSSVTQPRTTRRRTTTRAALALGVAGVLVVGALLLTGKAPTPVHLGKRTQVTLEPGLEIDPALSPDGRFVAYSGPQGELMVRQVEEGTPIQVARQEESRGRWPAWTPDGQRLVYLSPRGVEVVSALGGVPRLLLAGGPALARGVAMAPDGQSFAVVSHDSLYARPLDGGVARLITVGRELHSPAWSPDSRWIAFVSGNPQYISSTDLGNVALSSVRVVRASGGSATRISDERSLNVSPAWASARTLLFVSDRDGGRDIYQVSLTRSGSPVAPPVRLTTGLNPHGISTSLNGTRLAYSAFTETSNVWSVPIPSAGSVSISQARPVTLGNQTIENLGVSRDGRWVGFSSNRSGGFQIYRLPLGGRAGEPQQLTTDTAGSFWVDWSPDDRQIAFHRFHGERRQVFVMPSEGGAPTPVTDGTDDERSPEWSPDGNTLLLLANWATRPALHLVTRSGDGHWSAPRPLPVLIGRDTISPGIAAWSPDGHFIACGCGEGGLVIVPAGGGPARRLASPFSTTGWAFPQWSADGRTLFHVSEDSGRVVAVVAVPLSGAPPRIVLRFDDPTRPWHRFGFRVRAGSFFFTLGDRQSDIWVAEMGEK
jgi:serine/threonine-protein kinase